MRLMKKLTAALLTAAMMMTVAGCGAKEEPIATYTSKNGNYSIDISGSDFKDDDKGEESISLNNGKFAYGITQFSKATMEEQGIFTFDKFSSEMSARTMSAFSLTNVPEVVVTTAGLKAAKGWMLDLTEQTKTQAFLVLGETEDAFYQFIAESTKKDYSEEKFIKALDTLKEIKSIARPEEISQTYTSESGKFSIDIPGEWEEEDTGAGVMLTCSTAVLKVEMISKEQATAGGIADLTAFAEVLTAGAGVAELEGKSTVTEESYEPGKFLAAKAYVYDADASDGTKQMFVYLESDKNYISFNIGSSADGFDTIMERYGQVIQGIVEE